MSVQSSALQSTNFTEELEDFSLKSAISEAEELVRRITCAMKKCDSIYNVSDFNRTVPLPLNRIKKTSEALSERKADYIDCERAKQELIKQFGKYDNKYSVTDCVTPRCLPSDYHYSHDVNEPLSPKAQQAAHFAAVIMKIQLQLQTMKGNIDVLEQRVPSFPLDRYCTIL